MQTLEKGNEDIKPWLSTSWVLKDRMVVVMTSAELNQRIAEIAEKGDEFGFEAFGGKAIPYIGWFWRTVDFDQPTYDFGVMEPFVNQIGSLVIERNDTRTVGFMENNKWGYGYVHANAEEWANIKRLLETAVSKPCEETLRAVNDVIQALNEPEREAETEQ